jgi:hypothetical protein
MEQVPPRLHREFFDIIKRAEDIFEQKAKVSSQIYQPILESAISRYLHENRSPFQEYLLQELRKRLILYESLPSCALNELLGDPEAAAKRAAFLLR